MICFNSNRGGLMNYRIYDKDKRNIQGSAVFHIYGYEVSFGKAFNGQVKVTNNEHSRDFKDMEEAMEWIKDEQQRQFDLDD